MLVCTLHITQDVHFPLQWKINGKIWETTHETSHKIDAIVRTVSFSSVSCFSCDILNSHDVAVDADGMLTG